MEPSHPPVRGPQGLYELLPASPEEAELLEDERVLRALALGEARAGHPEGVLGLHVQRQWEFIDRAGLANRREQRLIALLHDLAKNLPEGPGRHPELSARFAEEQGLDPPIVEVIRVHDENWYALQRWRKEGAFDLEQFVKAYVGVDLDLLVPFKYADNCDRELFPVFWLEHRLVESGVEDAPYYARNPAVIAENNVVRGFTRPHLER